MRLGARQMYLLTRLGELNAPAKASDLSGCEMRPEQAAAVLKRLRARNLVRTRDREVCTWTTFWVLTCAAREVLDRMYPENRKSAAWAKQPACDLIEERSS